MRLLEIVRDCEIIETRGEMNIDVPEIRYDSRMVKDGDMFIAVVGFKTDGHNYIATAIDNGAKVIVMQDGKLDASLIRNDITVIITPDTRKFMALARHTAFP